MMANLISQVEYLLIRGMTKLLSLIRIIIVFRFLILKENSFENFGSKGEKDGELNCPHAVVVDSNGNYFVSDTSNHRIQIFDENGVFIWKFGSHGTKKGELSDPIGIGLLSNGNIVVSECKYDRISIFDSQGNFIKIIEDGDLSKPMYLFIDLDDNVLVADQCDQSIAIYSSETGELLKTVEVQSVIGLIYGITMDLNGRIIASGEKCVVVAIY